MPEIGAGAIMRISDMTRRTSGRSGFTLIEILVVISITILLMGLILAPIIQTFAMTQQTNTMVQAQDTARITLETVSREIGQAMYIRDNSNQPINFPCMQPNGTQTVFQALYGKIDIVLPKLVMHCNYPDAGTLPGHPTDKPRDYDRGDEAWPPCPYCAAAGLSGDVTDDDVEARPRQPLVADTKIVRYFIGLANNDPRAASKAEQYPNPGFRDWQDSGAPFNGFVLYRIEFDPSWRYQSAPTAEQEYRIDGDCLFQTGTDGKLNIDDPNFFYSTDAAPNNKPYWENWKKVAKVVVPKMEMDLIKLQMNAAGTSIASITPSVRFQFAQKTNDPFAPASIADSNAEAPAAIPTVYRSTNGLWGTYADANWNDNPYTVTVVRDSNTTFKLEWSYGSGSPDAMVWKYSRTGTGAAWTRTPEFDLTNYQATGAVGPAAYPEIMFNLDTSRGEARFDMQGEQETILAATITDMNLAARTSIGGTETGTYREYRIHFFDSIDPQAGWKGGGAPPEYRIVPGSEIVIGPDMSPGIADGDARPVRYERVPFSLGQPGRNQYKIDYGTDDATGHKVGWIFFSPASDEKIPVKMFDPVSGTTGEPAQITVTYRYQANLDGDVVTGSYSTMTLLNITMGIRYFDRGSGKVQPVELTNQVRVRNVMR